MMTCSRVIVFFGWVMVECNGRRALMLCGDDWMEIKESELIRGITD